MKGNYRGRGRGMRRPEPDAHRINKRIRVPDVRLIADDGEQLGIQPTTEALRIAQERGLDLVEVAPNSKPPVCKLMDYGKFKYEEKRKVKAAQKKQSKISIKELRIRYRTDSGDLETKLRKAREFLEHGDKVKFSMRFRGREVIYVELGVEKFQEIAERLKDVAIVDEQSPPRGRQIFITFAPHKTAP